MVPLIGLGPSQLVFVLFRLLSRGTCCQPLNFQGIRPEYVEGVVLRFASDERTANNVQ